MQEQVLYNFSILLNPQGDAKDNVSIEQNSNDYIKSCIFLVIAIYSDMEKKVLPVGTNILKEL